MWDMPTIMEFHALICKDDPASGGAVGHTPRRSPQLDDLLAQSLLAFQRGAAPFIQCKIEPGSIVGVVGGFRRRAKKVIECYGNARADGGAQQ